MITVKEVPPPPTPPSTYVVELSKEDAETLSEILGAIGGSGWRRNFISELGAALSHAGVRKHTQSSEVFDMLLTEASGFPYLKA